MSVHPLSPALLLLAEAANKFRSYEAQHRAKNTAESLAKAEVNAEIAGRIEGFVRETASSQVAAHRTLQEVRSVTPDEWSELERLADAATPGPWYRGHNENGCAQGEMSVWPDAKMIGAIIAKCGHQAPWAGWFEQPAKDAAFIAAANPSVIKRLIAALRASAKTGHGESVRAFRSHQDRRFLAIDPASVTMDYRGTVAENRPPLRGEIRVIDGRECRFIERELEGDKWEIIGPVVRK